MMLIAVLLISLVPNCVLSEVNYYTTHDNFDVLGPLRFFDSSKTTTNSVGPHNVLKFMKKLYKKVNSGRIPLPSDANTVRSIWPLRGNSQKGYLLYNIMSKRTEKIVKSVLFSKGQGHSRHPARILIDVMPIQRAVTPPGIISPLKEVDHLDINRLVVHAQATGSLLTMKLQELQNGSWTGFDLKMPPIIVVFSSDEIPPTLESLAATSPFSAETTAAKVRSKRESNSIHSNFIFKDLPEEFDATQTLEKAKLKSVISKRQKYLRKKLDQKKSRKHKKHRKSKRKRQKKKNGLIPYPKNYPRASKDHGGSKKRKKILSQTFITASMNHISNDVSQIPDQALTSSGDCELQEMTVDFKELGWDFVIAPAGFSPNYCSGGCPNPLSRTVAGTNYALIRSLMRHMGPWRNLSPSYCMADKITSLTLLIQTEDGKIELKNYPQMQAESCSCQ